MISSQDRRQFHQQSLLAAATLLQPPAKKRRLCVIGATGRGDYGHGLDTAFAHRTDVELVAVADANAAGLKKATERLKASKSYIDYRKMLEVEKPELVVVAARHSDQHFSMGMAAVNAGAHIYMEKPFMPTLVEADGLLKAAQEKGLKIAVAHQMRMEPSVTALKKAIGAGQLGDLLEIHAWGKQDNARAGGEDMIVLGTHLFDLMRLFGGNVKWCQSGVTQGGKEITKANARLTKDLVGPVAGDEVIAQFGFDHGVVGTFNSRAKLREAAGPWGLEIIGTKGSARVLTNVPAQVFVKNITPWNAEGHIDTWKRPAGPVVPSSFALANARLVDDLIVAIEERREPECSGQNAMKAIEMVMGVYQSALSHSRVVFPLTERSHPLIG